ncbi:MAG: RecBCD enzyme subunit RecC [Chlamydiales bacterium]|nr:RecBCD enzyme subunit RecC [Chlamydiales bacterium]
MIFKDVKEEKNLDIRRFNQGVLFFSNSIEVLFQLLQTNLLSSGSSVFSERMVIAPSQAMQGWIQMQLADSVGIAGGITPLFLDKAIGLLTKKFFHSKQEHLIPNQLELFLALERELQQVMEEREAIWEPLQRYLKGKEHRLIPLAQHLCQLFRRYGVFANVSAKQWECSAQSWQEVLWARVFKKWSYPQRALLDLEERGEEARDLSVHLFAFSHLSPLHFDFFSKLSKRVPLFFYQLSPCQEFWSGLDEQTPPLLAHFGKVGREMARIIEQSTCETEEAYIEFRTKNQLNQIQSDLLNMRPTTTILEDDSVQVHLSTTPYREIENLYETLIKLMEGGSIEPRDILVMAPNIAVYAPYIQAVFGEVLGYQIADLPMKQGSVLVEGVFLLLDLDKKRWSAPAVLELFNHPLFRQKQRFCEEDILQLRAWVEQTGIIWGVDAQQREEILRKNHCQAPHAHEDGSWKAGFGHLIEELAVAYEVPRVDLTQAKLLGDFYTLLDQLRADLQQIEENKTLREWIDWIKRLVELYFASAEDSERLFSKLEQIAVAGRHFSDKLYSFNWVLSLLHEWIGSESVTLHRHRLQAVRFCSMLPMRAIPAKVICLIGMNHDAFPRREELQTLDLLKHNSHSDYSPSRLDFDRYLFLEAVLSVREKFILSYLGRDPYDLTELPPSSVITELLHVISKKQIKVHPAYRFVEGEQEPLIPSFSARSVPLPKGEFVIEIKDWTRLIYAPIDHYLRAHQLKIQKSFPASREQEMSFSPSKMALLQKKVLFNSLEQAEKKVDKEGGYPEGVFGQLARLKLHAALEKFVSQEVQTVHFDPVRYAMRPNLIVNFLGSFQGVYDEGLYVFAKCDFKAAVKALPQLVLLHYLDPSKHTLFFAKTGEKKSCFFENRTDLLESFVEYYFFAQQCPSPLIADWVESILKQDAKKLCQSPVYDETLQWYVRGKKGVRAEQIIEQWHPWVKRLYGEMADAWF